MQNKELLVAAIKNGTVIDHIPASKTFEVVNLLGLTDLKSAITIGCNLHSEKVGSKGIIKVEDKFFTDEEISRLSVVAPNAVLNIITDYTVVEKKPVIMPATLRGIVHCPNPKCICNNEPMQTIFHYNGKNHTFQCHYCNTEVTADTVKVKP
ncbi:MAG: aspartate carbamoyltransferase regulatory subunit [Bacteroidaceae bacterium]|nr:aspartate carbamoyltransferase regulatory subunit [Bacteroidaceae bacterium]